MGRKVDMTVTHIYLLLFRHGWHTCPRRFFVVAELALMLAHIVMEYDVKLEDLH